VKVKISVTEEVTDEQRLAIAKKLHGPEAKKDQATREELKDFVWRGGRDWALLLQRADEFEEDLIGAGVDTPNPNGSDAQVANPNSREPEGMDLI
jgi:hypothetical protein